MDPVDWNPIALGFDTTGEYLYSVLMSGDDMIDSTGYGSEDAPVELWGEAGDDEINGGAGSDLVYGNAGDDTIILDDGDDSAYGGAGNDTIYGGAGSDYLSGGDGNDTLDVQEDALSTDEDEIAPGNGNDTIIVGASQEVTLNYSDLSSAVTVDLAAGTATATGKLDTISNGAGISRVYGTSFDDTITGSVTRTVFIGLAGDDTFTGVDGVNDGVYYDYDYRYGGTSAVTVNLGAGWATDGFGDTDTFTSVEQVRGTMFNDTVYGSDRDVTETYRMLAGDDYIDGGDGWDVVSYATDYKREDSDGNKGTSGVVVNLATHTATDGFGDTDTLINIEEVTGTQYADIIKGSAAVETLNGEDGNDKLYGYGGADTLNGGNGNDLLAGGGGADVMTGGAGNDTYWVDTANDKIIELAGGGKDLVKSSVSFSLKAHSQYVENLTLTGNAAINGTGNALANIINGNNAANKLYGLYGADKLYGLGGNDILSGGVGNDTLFGNVGNDKLYGNTGNDTLYGGLGNDLLDGGLGADTMVGNQGNDTYVVNHIGDSVKELAGQGVDLVRSTISFSLAAKGANVENLTLLGTSAINGTGNALANVINGNAASNTLHGLVGNDHLNGNGGDDKLFGDNGNDTLNGGDGNDTLNGGNGNDVLNGQVGNDKLFGGAGFDKLYGGNGNDILHGQLGNDILVGGNGNDQLYGELGADKLYGNAGADTLVGGAGADSLYAGVDNAIDTFVFNSVNDSVAGSTYDTIYQFESGEDVIDLSAIDADTSTTGDQAFTFAGTTATANSVWYETDGTDLHVYADVDGDASADFEIQLDSVTSLTDADFSF